jgi:hypothetical protein
MCVSRWKPVNLTAAILLEAYSVAYQGCESLEKKENVICYPVL